ncbi:3-hydroxyacyl-ACP dehydratase [Flavihumibacter stibioxidans]|nr:3-hydroxyacyl-ACP dehydratase [Flavihumibacter stibioxidans]
MSLLNKENITSVIPQRPPFVMIDELIQCDENLTRTAFTVRQDNLFLENGRLGSSAMVENIAQTAAAGSGYKALKENGPVLVGFIGAIKNLVIADLPAAGDLLQTETRLVNSVFNVSIVEGKVFSGDKLMASCEMKIFLQPPTGRPDA